MRGYLAWSLQQLYMLFFRPGLTVQDRGDGVLQDRTFGFILWYAPQYLRYVARMLPWIIALTCVGNIAIGCLSEQIGVPYTWRASWRAAAVGVLFGTAFGLVLDVALDMTLALAVTLASGMAFGVASGVSSAIGMGTAIAVASIVGFVIGHSVASPLGWCSRCLRLAMYPLNAGLSTAVYLAARWRPHAAPKAWAWCPVVWNETIWLPLPFVGRLLALMARQDRDGGFGQIAFVAAERTLQRHAAMGALVEVALQDLAANSVAELADVTEGLGWITDAPTELPETLAMALRRLDRASQQVGQYLILHSAYRKLQAISRAIQEVDELQRNLIAARGRLAPLMLRVANQWRALLDAENVARRTRAEGAREIPNPFVFGSPIVETVHNVFSGRADVMRQMEAGILGAVRPPTLMLYGPRRIGKTSILYQLPRLLGPGLAPAILDCQDPAVTESPAGALRCTSEAAIRGLRHRHVTAKPLAPHEISQGPFSAFHDWLNRTDQAMPEGMQLLLCIDEYERLYDTLAAGWGVRFLDSLRHTLQHCRRVAVMFTGTHTFEELGPEWTDRFVSARRVRVSFLGRDEVVPLLTQPIPEFDMTYAPGALDAVIDATRGQPFLTQAVGFELVQLLNEHERKEATPDDAAEAITRALVSGGEYFANVWDDAGEGGRTILCALARHDTPPADPAAQTHLRGQDVLTDSGAFAVPMVERWVREKKA